MTVRPSLVRSWGDMNFLFGATESAVNFSLPKTLLQHFPVESGESPALALALRFLRPLDYQASELPSRISLTDVADYESQIRFFSAERVKRFYHTFGVAMQRQYPDLRVTIHNPDALDSGSRQFVKGLGLQRDPVPIDLAYRPEVREDVVRYAPTSEELQIDRLCRLPGSLDDADLAFLSDRAEQYLSVGDSYTAINIMERVLLQRQDSRSLSVIGLTSLLLGRPIEAEYWYRKWAEISRLDRARANYAMSMLYARHHPPFLRSIEVAGDLLEDAYKILLDMTEVESPKIVFERVFNRNGYALIEFRRGHVDSALALVSDGITTIEQEVGPEHLHKTVLLYNRAQCYARLQNWEMAISEYRELIRLDPWMPEYHGELARCYINMNRHEDAIRELTEAHGLDASIPETAAIMAFANFELERFNDSAEWYEIALNAATSVEFLAYDYAYVLAKLGKWKECRRVLVAHKLKYGEAALTPDAISLLAEAETHVGEFSQAITILKDGIDLYPADSDLRDNLTMLENV